MKDTAGKKIGGFVGRFTLIHLIAYSVIAFVFLLIQNGLPAVWRVGLDFFEPYSINLTGTLAQVIIGAVIALVLYPFYDIIVKGKRGLLILFAALWGVVLLGSLEPKPGTIEGMLYTEITFFEHFLVLAAGALQVLLFAWLFLRWERRDTDVRASAGEAVAEKPGVEINSGTKKAWGYTGRFTLVHVLIYVIVGALFYQISGYEEALATMEEFALWRDLETMIMPLIILFGQIIRGGILALLLYPFYSTYIKQRRGWLLLFGLLFGLKVLATVISVPATFDELVHGLETITIGLPEITAQTLLFASVFFIWESRKYKKLQLKQKLTPEI